MPSQLYDDRHAPITKEIGFLECDAATAAAAFQEWQLPIQSGRGVRLNRRELVADFPAKLEGLLPLTSHEARRFLFLPTASKWTAYLDSGWRGTDAFSTVSYLATTIGCRGIRAVSVPDTMRKTPTGELGRYGATILEVYAADSSGCSFLNVRRSVFAANDGGRWKFGANGQPFAFENLEHTRPAKSVNASPQRCWTNTCTISVSSSSPLTFTTWHSQRTSFPKKAHAAAGMKEYSLAEARSSY